MFGKALKSEDTVWKDNIKIWYFVKSNGNDFLLGIISRSFI